MTMMQAIKTAPSRPVTVRQGGIERALQWAFGAEKAELVPPHAEYLPDRPPGRGTEAVIADRLALGACVDGGGRSLPHHEADEIAAAVSKHLPWYLAVIVAENARAGTRPLGQSCAWPRFIPALGWQQGAHGSSARTEVAEVYEVKARGRRGRMSRREDRCCPIRLAPAEAVIVADQQTYTRWLSALRTVRDATARHLTCWVMTDDMPPERPWED